MPTKTNVPISDYGYISDCHSSALISKYGSIDWCCMPRIDSASCFGRLLDWENGGHCQIRPIGRFKSSQRYRERTMILETLFQTKTGEALLTDFFTMRKGGQHKPYQQIIRVLEVTSGNIRFRLDLIPCFDYAAVKPWIRRYKRSSYIALGSNNGLLISGNMPLNLKNPHEISSEFQISKKRKIFLSIIYRRPEYLDEASIEVPSVDELDWRLQQTEQWWFNWFAQGTIKEPYADLIARSALVLKSLSNAPTGAIAAAATTSLPEAPHGSRNWDYRYSWIRDSYFTVRCLTRLGFTKEAEGFSRFVIRSCHSSMEGLQILFGVAGEARINEYILEDLSGYFDAKPVRIGNAAVKQLQFDLYGELLDLTWNWHQQGFIINEDYWSFLVEIANFVTKSWCLPDHGIWEVRDQPRHFVLSKAMCWLTLERGIKLAEKLGFNDAPIDTWKKAKDMIRATIEEKGYDQKRGVFTQAFGVPYMDASLLLLPLTEFVDFKDERMIRTTEAIWQDLQVDGLLLRYPKDTDGLEGEEGVFIPCSFWLVTVLLRQNRLQEAQEIFERAIATSNHLGLFSEEYDTKNKAMLGNFPQGLTHLSFTIAALTLQHTMDRGANPL